MLARGIRQVAQKISERNYAKVGIVGVPFDKGQVSFEYFKLQF